MKVKVYSVKEDIEPESSFIVTDISLGVPGSGSIDQVLKSFIVVHVELEEEWLMLGQRKDIAL